MRKLQPELQVPRIRVLVSWLEIRWIAAERLAILLIVGLLPAHQLDVLDGVPKH